MYELHRKHLSFQHSNGRKCESSFGICGEDVGCVWGSMYLQRSESLEPKRSSIDFKSETIQINYTTVKNLSTVFKDKTKTSSSKRTYVLLPEIKDLLLNLYGKQKTIRSCLEVLILILTILSLGQMVNSLDQIMLLEDFKECEKKWFF